MAWTQTDRDQLAAAIATGAQRVKFQTHETQFRSQKEMLELLNLIDLELNPANAPARRTVARYFSGF